MSRPDPQYDRIYLASIRFDPDREVEWFTLLLEGNTKYDLILTSPDGYLVFFRDASQAQHYLEAHGGEAFRQFSPAPIEVLHECDVAQTLYFLHNKQQDEIACIVETLNTLFDFVAATRSEMPGEYREHLERLADHFTFHRNINLDSQEKELATNGILWCVGAIVCKSHFLAD